MPTGNGSEGWATTGATTDGSTIIASANPPVKHMPSAPTPGPPSSPCSERARDRSHTAIGEVCPVAMVLNSRLTQTFGSTWPTYAGDMGRSGVPKRCGITTVNPAATTSSQKPMTSGVRPGISWITITPGPVPLRYVGWVTPSAVWDDCVQLSRRAMPAVWRRPARRRL